MPYRDNDRVFPVINGNTMDEFTDELYDYAPDIDSIKQGFSFPSLDGKPAQQEQTDLTDAGIAPDFAVDGAAPVADDHSDEDEHKSAAVTLLSGILEERYIGMEKNDEDSIDKIQFPALKTALGLSNPIDSIEAAGEKHEKMPELFSNLELKRDGSYTTTSYTTEESADGTAVPALFAGIGRNEDDEVTAREINPDEDSERLFSLIDQYEAEIDEANEDAALNSIPVTEDEYDPYNTAFNMCDDDINEADSIPDMPMPKKIKLRPLK